MKIEFVGGFTSLDKHPMDGLGEFAFLGRSNVGKSSLLNMVSGQKMARVSNSPGKTQEINYFKVDDSWYLVDVPGYGYAKKSKSMRAAFAGMIKNYIKLRMEVRCAFLLVDINVPPQKIDLEMAGMMAEAGMPFVLVFTKADKQKSYRNQESMKAFEEAMLENWETMPQVFLTSAEYRIGRDELLDFITSVNNS